MKYELKQKRFFSGRQLIIHDSRLTYKTFKFGDERELNIAFEDIASYKESFIISTPVLGAASIIGFALTILCFSVRDDKDTEPYAWLFWLTITSVLVFLYFASREIVWRVKFHNFSYIYLNKNNPDKNSVNEFLDLLFEIRKKYLRDTYFFVNKNMPYETQFNNLKWLKGQEAIDQAEFEATHKKLNDLFNFESRQIGFFNN